VQEEHKTLQTKAASSDDYPVAFDQDDGGEGIHAHGHHEMN
jgi:hypothetical protein